MKYSSSGACRTEGLSYFFLLFSVSIFNGLPKKRLLFNGLPKKRLLFNGLPEKRLLFNSTCRNPDCTPETSWF